MSWKAVCIVFHLFSNHLSCAKGIDVCGAKAQIAQHLLSVLPLERRGHTYVAGSLAELDRQTKEPEIGDERMGDIDDHIPRPSLWVGEDVVEGVHRRTRHTGLVQHLVQHSRR